jgi:serine/threonine-protein kinase
MALQVGETLGRYQLEQLVGQGGMAVVYRAVDSVLGRTVAVKVIRQAYTEDPHFLERFLQEARLVANLDHPNILPLYDFGEQDGRPYLVMPYLPGGSVAEQMAALPQPLPLVAAWTMQLAGALDAAHARGVLHRDVKPGNVLVTKDGRLVLGDFGIARLTEATTRLTATGMVVGTPIYMAPELARGADASPASDRYALAVMVYEMLAGLPPFVGSNPLSVLHQQVHEPVPTLVERNADATPELDAFMERALAKKPEERHPSGRAMAEGLLTLLTAEQRAELSTLAWSGTAGSGEGLPWSSPDAATMVRSGGTLRLPERKSTPGRAAASGAARSSGAPRPSGPTRTDAAAGGVLTSAVTAEAPRRRRSSPLVWGLLAAVAVAAAVLLLPRELLMGAKQSAGDAAASDGEASASSATAQPAGGAAGPATAQPATSGSMPTGSVAPGATQAAGTRAAPASADGPSAGGAESREVPPLDPPALGLPIQIAIQWTVTGSRPARRPGEAELLHLVQSTGGDRPVNLAPARLAVNLWTRGALAYLRGRLPEAAELRRDVVAESAPWGIGWAKMMFARSASWDLAAFYGDPRRELERLLEPELSGLAGNPRAAVALAYSSHLSGDHANALKVFDQIRFDPAAIEPTQRALAAQFLAVEAIEARDGEAVRHWMPYALGDGNAPLLGAFIGEATLLARNNFGEAQAAAMRTQLCQSAPGACGLLQQRPMAQSPAWRNQPRPQVRPKDWNPRRRQGPKAAPTGSSGGGG